MAANDRVEPTFGGEYALLAVAGAIVGDGCIQRAVHTVPCCIRAEAGTTPDIRGLVNVEIALAESADRDGRRMLPEFSSVPTTLRGRPAGPVSARTLAGRESVAAAARGAAASRCLRCAAS